MTTEAKKTATIGRARLLPGHGKGRARLLPGRGKVGEGVPPTPTGRLADQSMALEHRLHDTAKALRHHTARLFQLIDKLSIVTGEIRRFDELDLDAGKVRRS